MLFSKQRDLADSIVEMTMRNPISIKSLHGQLETQRKGLSLRAVYKAVGVLVVAGVLIKAGKSVRVDQEWLRVLRGRLQPATVPLRGGERVSYSFSSLPHLDAFWKTMAFQLEEYEQDGRIFFYNPHDFWAYIPERQESEQAYYRHFGEVKRHAFFTVGGITAGDREFKKAFQDEYLQIDTRNILSLSRKNHLTVLGDFVITVSLGKGFAAQIDEIYASERPISEFLPDMAQAYSAAKRVRLMLENNPQKAKKLRKMLSLHFYFRKESL